MATSPAKILMEFLKSGKYKVRFRWLAKHDFARIEPQKKRVSINLSAIVAHYIAHEFLHTKYPLMSDPEGNGKIDDKAWWYVEKMTVSEIKKIFRYLLKNCKIR